MASKYNFDDAYSTDSCTDSDWEKICGHVGLEFGDDEEEKTDIVEDNGDEEKEQSSNDVPEKNNAEQEKADEVHESESESMDTDFVIELRQEMKVMRKILKKGQIQLHAFDENDMDGIKETYKEWKHSSRSIKKKFKALLYKSGDDLRNVVKPDISENIPVDTVNEGRKSDPQRKHVQDKKENIAVDTEPEGRKSASPSKPRSYIFQGQQRYNCPSCDFVWPKFGTDLFAHVR